MQYTDAVRNNRVNEFYQLYQSIDVLLMDDIQEFAGKTQTQNTFFHIFNHLHQSNKQLVLTCDRPPVELVGMVSRLLTRFKWGLTAEVERPDYELRYDILMSKVRRDGLSISEEVIDYIARNVTDNVRDLEGVIVSLMVRSSVLKKEISIDMADQVLAASVKMTQKQITIDSIKEAGLRILWTGNVEIGWSVLAREEWSLLAKCQCIWQRNIPLFRWQESVMC